jgi:hypothetical protein
VVHQTLTGRLAGSISGRTTGAMAGGGGGVVSVSGLGERPGFPGVLTAALGAGSIVASLPSSRLLAHWGERVLAILGSVVLGFALPWVFLAVLNLAQRATPDSLQGRVSAALIAGWLCWKPVSWAGRRKCFDQFPLRSYRRGGNRTRL